jgi:hypothetical protein
MHDYVVVSVSDTEHYAEIFDTGTTNVVERTSTCATVAEAEAQGEARCDWWDAQAAQRPQEGR